MSKYGHPNAAAKNATYGPPPPSQAPAPPQAGFTQQGTRGQSEMTPAFGGHPGYVPAGPVYGQPAAVVGNQLQQRPKRATQACEQCRQRKQKCDEGNPCSFCKESSLACQYRDTPPAKTDKKMENVILRLKQIVKDNQDLRQDLATRLSVFDGRLRQVERQSIDLSDLSEPEEAAPRRKPELDDHRTAPHKLILLWPSVRRLLQGAEVKVNDAYVMEAEDRGVLRLYGRGEGIEEQDGTQSGGPAHFARSEDSSFDAPSPPEGVWGRGLPAYAYLSSKSRAHQSTAAGGLKPDGTLDLDQTTINTLWESYVRHMHAMHPFLDKSETRGLLDDFISRYPPSRHRTRSHNGFVSAGGETDRPLRRQRSKHTDFRRITALSTTERFVETERSPSNALIYLILALGKICAHEGPLPGPVQESVSNADESLPHQFSLGLGMHGASPTMTDIESSSATPTATPSFPQTARNMDVIPGIAYYSKAAAILGEQGDGNELIHAQMFLLAGLYKGQLARVKESMSWIGKAGTVVLALLDRYKMYNNNYWTAYGDLRRKQEKGQKLITDMRENLIVLASWTCLQLEGDILAELRLPSSGIQNIENFLLMPRNLAEGDEDRKDEIYNDTILSQINMRKRLDQVHKELYGPKCLSLPLTEVQVMLNGHQAILDDWRATLPRNLKWSDSEEPPPDILSASLRAKYWRARYLTNRPFLDYALHIMRHFRKDGSVKDIALDAHGNPRDKAEIHLFKAIELMGEGAVEAACQRCIEAAMQSTVALDGVPDRLVVTNIHGTAHAQFGNMLVLSAVWQSGFLRELIDKERFQALLKRTIEFLRKLSAISPTCQQDCAILEIIQRVLFGGLSKRRRCQGLVERTRYTFCDRSVAPMCDLEAPCERPHRIEAELRCDVGLGKRPPVAKLWINGRL